MPRRWVARRGPQPVEAGRGEDRLGAASVGEARVALDRAVADEAVDQPRHAALAEQHLVGEAVHPHPAAGRLGELEEGVVFGERQVVLGAELLVEQPLEAGVGEEERAPRREARVARGHVAARDGEAGSHGTPFYAADRCQNNDPKGRAPGRRRSGLR